MSPTAALESPQPPTGAGFSDAVTFAFGDLDAQLFGVARVGLSPGEDGAPQASGLAVLFSGFEPIAVRAAGGLPVAAGAGWEDVDAAGVRTTTQKPLSTWDVAFVGDDASTGFALRFEALSPAGALAEDDPVAEAGGMQGYEQLCRVTGVATVGGEERAVRCLGQRGHSWGAPDWERITLARTVSAWMDEDLAIAVTAIRPRRAKSHADEALAASLFLPLDEDGTIAAIAVPEVRLSTTTDAEGRQRKAGVELFLDEEDPGHRAAGEVLCGTSLDLGRLRLDCSFFVWRMEGLTGVGRYDVLRHAT
ncbi:MAG: hypothetical protein JWO90_3302 [Solirubrobacterales bacterium]|nr:hypothetical protein [Solirubrobacterales bacterium]